MTNKKNIAAKLVLALFILTLISCCLLGSTFARYASGGSGTASIGVAEWDVAITPETSFEVETNKISPSMDVYDGTARTHESDGFAVATIINTGDVDAKVTVTVGEEISFTMQDSCEFGSGIFVDGESYTGTAATEEQVEDLFTIKLYTDADCTTELSEKTNTVAAESGSLTIYAQITWTSDDTGTNAAYADALDTWVGENVTSLSFTLSYTAVQASTLPPT